METPCQHNSPACEAVRVKVIEILALQEAEYGKFCTAICPDCDEFITVSAPGRLTASDVVG